jgi:hypothetical protein
MELIDLFVHLCFMRSSIAEIQPNSKKIRQTSLHGFQVGSQK